MPAIAPRRHTKVTKVLSSATKAIKVARRPNMAMAKGRVVATLRAMAGNANVPRTMAASPRIGFITAIRPDGEKERMLPMNFRMSAVRGAVRANERACQGK